MTPLLGATELRRGLLASLDALRANRPGLDALNVYPVPDSDTGTNLVLTFEAVAEALADAGDTPAGVAEAVRRGALMGARGNSGVITAQILRAWADAVEAGPAGPAEVADAFARGARAAYEAVLQPAEGTILTVARAAAEAAAGTHADVGSQFAAAARASAVALEQTKQQLETLARADVVDAGGAGLVVVLAAIAGALGSVVDDIEPVRPLSAGRARACESASTTFRYEVQYLLAAPDERVAPLRQLLGTIGDSVVVTGGAGTWRVHVHTDDGERALALGRAVGEVSDPEIVSLEDQVRALHPEATPEPRDMQPRANASAPRARGERGVELSRAEDAPALVAVATGEGLKRLFAEAGAVVVDADPTRFVAREILDRAIRQAPGASVIVIPNNENVLGTAVELAMERSAGKDVRVVRALDVAAGLAAALSYADGRPLEPNLEDMHQAIARVRTGQVVTASASLQTPAGFVQEGQAVAVAEGEILEPSDDPVAALSAVLRALLTPAAEVVTVIAGEDVGEVERERARQAARSMAPRATTEVVDGGQPVHRYVVGVE